MGNRRPGMANGRAQACLRRLRAMLASLVLVLALPDVVTGDPV
jgi:hypothetical protein